MNLMSKGALAAMTLALDFAAGSALDQLWDMNWTAESAEVQTVDIVDRQVLANVATIGIKPQPGGGVCKPSEHSVMVMEIDRSSSQEKALPKQVCIRALSGEPEIAAQLEGHSSQWSKH